MQDEELLAHNPTNSTGLLKSAGLIVVVILLSKIAGFLRDVIIANYYGASIVSDAYFYAYQIPALAIVILGGMGGPFHSATVSVFSKIIKNFNQKPDSEVKRLFNTFETFSILIFGSIAAICFFFPKQVMNIIISQATPELMNLAAYHLKIMSPVKIPALSAGESSIGESTTISSLSL